MEDLKNDRNTFALFFSAIFLPHPDVNGNEILSQETFQEHFSWDAFCNTIRKMENSEKMIELQELILSLSIPALILYQ